jgi:hypothetical protein
MPFQLFDVYAIRANLRLEKNSAATRNYCVGYAGSSIGRLILKPNELEFGLFEKRT